MMFASKTPRDLNRDPRPLSTIGTGRRVAVGSNYAGETVPNPRPEYDHPQHNEPNPILAAFRRDADDMRSFRGWDVAQTARSWDADAIESFADMYAAAALNHARRVLARLANLTEQETTA